MKSLYDLLQEVTDAIPILRARGVTADKFPKAAIALLTDALFSGALDAKFNAKELQELKDVHDEGCATADNVFSISHPGGDYYIFDDDSLYLVKPGGSEVWVDVVYDFIDDVGEDTAFKLLKGYNFPLDKLVMRSALKEDGYAFRSHPPPGRARVKSTPVKPKAAKKAGRRAGRGG